MIKRVSKLIKDFSGWVITNGYADGLIEPFYSRNLTFSIDGVYVKTISELRYLFKNYFNPNLPKFSCELTWKTMSNYIAGARYFLFSFGLGYCAYTDSWRTALVFYQDSDGILYIKGRNKMYKDITTTYADCNIMSALVLREFLFQL